MDESPAQYVTRLREYLTKWIELSETADTTESIIDLLVREQFLNSCSNDLATYLRLRPAMDLTEFAKSAENFLAANGKRSLAQNVGFRTSASKPSGSSGRNESDQHRKTGSEGSRQNSDNIGRNSNFTCYSCGMTGHKSSTCRTEPRSGSGVKCYRCNRFGHYSRNCTSNASATPSSAESNRSNSGRVSVGCAIPEVQPVETAEAADVISESDSGKQLVTVTKSGCSTSAETGTTMPVAKGYVGKHCVSVLRDSGCSGVIVKRKFVDLSQFTGEKRYVSRVDNTVIETPTVRIEIDSPYFCGETEAQCMNDALYDLIIGNVAGARAVENPDLNWTLRVDSTTQGGGAEENSVSASASVIPGSSKFLDLSKGDLIKLQKEDQTLAKYYEKKDVLVKGKSKSWFTVVDGVLYRYYKRIDGNGGRTWQQVMLPTKLRSAVMKVAHESLTGGHQGINKTLKKVETNFFWPGINSDIARYCQSCDACQRTAQKGLRKAPMGKMPIIDVPFRRVAIDLIGPIHSDTDEGYKYILTFIDYATRYPEAVPLKDCTTEAVADALFKIYCRLGVPEELLSDLGTQFVSECMNQVSALLGIHRLTTSVAHPEGNGLVENFNKTLKSMIRKLCVEEPESWHKYLDALLFACREVPQDSTGFAPFELLYGRTVRGPMQILKELWTNEMVETDVKLSYQYVFELRDRLEQTLKLARNALEKAHTKQKIHYDRRSKVRSLQVGDEVLIMLPTTANKLLMQWRGPFVITKRVGQFDYRVLVNGEEKTYHVNLLKKYNRRESSLLSTADGGENENIVVSGVCIVDEGETDDEITEFPVLRGKETVQDVKLGKDLSLNEREEMKQILRRYEEIFSDAPGRCNLIEHRIPLETDEPVQSRPYPIPYGIRDSVNADIKTMLELGIIQHSESPYASPVVVVRKRDKTNRICIDFRKLNKLTASDTEPMPQLNDMFQDLAEDNYFTKIDLSKGYWQIPMAEEDIPKTAFVLHDSKFEFLRMPFGLKSAGATLMKGMRKMLQNMENVHNYIDDLLVHTKTWEDHIVTVNDILGRLREAGLTARPSKSEFGLKRVEFLGHEVGQGMVQPHRRNLEKISDKERPQTKKDVRSLVALTGFYREYIPNFATLVAPFTDLTKKAMPNKIKWNDHLERSFLELKTALMSEPVLRLPDANKRFVLRTDASDVGVGAALMQEDEHGKLFPVCYASRKLLAREKNFSTIERECLGIIWAIQKFHMHLCGRRFVIQTDHESLSYLNKAKFVNARIMRWAMFLQQYDFVINKIKGKDNLEADYLSRVGFDPLQNKIEMLS